MTGTEAVAEGRRSRPNILITGTPGTGKTSTASALAAATGLVHVNVGEIVREKELHDGYDEEFESFVINEDKVCDELEEQMTGGGVIVDSHSCDMFPERWFDLVVVLQTDNSILYDRLAARGYTGRKLEENMECEIMQVLAEEARESYKPEIVICLQSDSVDGLEKNVETLRTWLQQRM